MLSYHLLNGLVLSWLYNQAAVQQWTWVQEQLPLSPSTAWHKPKAVSKKFCNHRSSEKGSFGKQKQCSWKKKCFSILHHCYDVALFIWVFWMLMNEPFGISGILHIIMAVAVSAPDHYAPLLSQFWSWIFSSVTGKKKKKVLKRS